MISNVVKKIPAGIMVVPLLLGIIVNTFLPDLLKIGGFTQALFVDGTTVLIALFLFCIGTQFQFKDTGIAIKKGLVLLILKWVVALLVTFVAFIFAGPTGLFLTLSPIAILAAMSNSAGGVYMAVAREYGDETDLAAYPILALNDGPFLTMIGLTIFGMMGFVEGFFSLIDFIAVLLPLILGAILGNIDENIRKNISNGMDIIIPFFAFGIGMGIELTSIFGGGIGGIAIGLMSVILTGGAAYIAFSLLGWNPIVGVGEGATAGNALATPAAIAAANPALNPFVETATIQIAACIVTSVIFTPVFITYLAKRLEKKNKLNKNVDIPT